MVPPTSGVRVISRRGFTLFELLVAMAQVVLIMAILSEAFVAGIESFRSLKALADLGEQLRGEAVALRDAVQATNRVAAEFILDGLRNNSVDREMAEALKGEYTAIRAHACDLEARLREAERRITNPVARRLIRRTLKSLEGVKAGASTTIELLELMQELE